ncbi:hypothetical protein PSM36_3426 [Proteiniphilum saccharofermentans]|uniref:Uncharacterized protein n=1 Tax=Proteiniphilum saccharofermentans TaxID=1642647 RepID=A0A1R3T4P8_9BACT|nr:hypothetical protein PSM36_3426 [Proteiniphilum saccharofermentans]
MGLLLFSLHLKNIRCASENLSKFSFSLGFHYFGEYKMRLGKLNQLLLILVILAIE